MRSSTAVGLPEVFGRLTSIPRYISGAVSMKIRSRTSVTSTSGMMLISARVAPMRWPPLSGSCELTVKAIGSGHPGWGGLGQRPAEQVPELEREAVHLHGPALHAVDEDVVRDDGGDRRAEAGGRCDERLRDARRDHGEVRRALGADALKGRHDAPHRPEQADERRGAGRRREE